MLSSIHSHPMLPSETGATQGKRIKRRTNHLPRKFFCSAIARIDDRTITTSCETKAKRKVFFSEAQNVGSANAPRKLSNPTKCPTEEETVTSLSANQIARKKGTP